LKIFFLGHKQKYAPMDQTLKNISLIRDFCGDFPYNTDPYKRTTQITIFWSTRWDGRTIFYRHFFNFPIKTRIFKLILNPKCLFYIIFEQKNSPLTEHPSHQKNMLKASSQVHFVNFHGDKNCFTLVTSDISWSVIPCTVTSTLTSQIISSKIFSITKCVFWHRSSQILFK